MGSFSFLRSPLLSTLVLFILLRPLFTALSSASCCYIGSGKEKTSLYDHAARTQGDLFFPVVFESFGAFGPGAVRFISKLVDEASTSGRQWMIKHLNLSFTVPFPLLYNWGKLTFCLLLLALRELEQII